MKRFYLAATLLLQLFHLTMAHAYTPGQAITNWNGTYTGYHGSTSTTASTAGVSAPVCTGQSCLIPSPSTYITTSSQHPNVEKINSFMVKVCSFNGSTYSWVGKSIPGSYVRPDFATNTFQHYTYDANYNSAVCGPPDCSSKTGQKGYHLFSFPESSPPVVPPTNCYEDCAQTTEITWLDCMSGDCAHVVQYTYTGEPCSGESEVSNEVPTPPERCTEELAAKIAQCGGSLNVQSFNFENCTGECTPDSCHAEYQALISRCGGVMAIATWNSTTCTGTCVNDEPTSPPLQDDLKEELSLLRNVLDTLSNTLNRISSDASEQQLSDLLGTAQQILSEIDQLEEIGLRSEAYLEQIVQTTMNVITGINGIVAAVTAQTPSLQSIDHNTATISGEITDINAKTGKVVQDVEAIKDGISSLLGGVQGVTDATNATKGSIDQLGGKLDGIATATSNNATAIGNLGGTLDGIATATGDTANAIGLLGDATAAGFGALGGLLGGLGEKLDGLIDAVKDLDDQPEQETFPGVNSTGFTEPYNPGEFDIPARFTTFLSNVKSSGLFSFSSDFFNSLPSGGSPVYEIDAGSYGHHSVDLSQSMSTGLAVLKTILLACFGFLSIRAVIMKR